MNKLSTSIRNKWSDSRSLLLLFIFSLAYLYLFVRVLWRVGDEGTLVYGAQLVAQGALPYRDFFEVMGPGSFYWLGLFFKLFGTNILVARAVLLFTASLTVALLYWMTRRVYQGPFDWLPSLFYLVVSFPLWPGTSHHWDSILFGLLTVGVFFLWQDRGRWWFLALAGILAGLTSCFIQQKGLYLVGALSLVVLINGYSADETKPRIGSHLGILLGSYVAVGSLVLLFFFFAGGLSDLVYANLIWPLTRYHNVNDLPYGYGLQEWMISFYHNLLQSLLPAHLGNVMGLLILLPLLLIILLPFLLFGLTGISYLGGSKRTKIFSPTMLPYWAAGLAFWVSELHRKDIIHLIYASPLLLILFLTVSNYCWDSKKALKYSVMGLITACIILFGGFNILIVCNAKHKIVTRRGVLYGFKEDPALIFLNEHTKPGDYAFIYPYYPMYYFLADVKNPTRYSILLYHINTKAQFNEVIKDIEHKKVNYVLWDTVVAGSNLKTWFPQYQHPSQENLDLERYLEEHYKVISIKNNFKILQRRHLALSNKSDNFLLSK